MRQFTLHGRLYMAFLTVMMTFSSTVHGQDLTNGFLLAQPKNRESKKQDDRIRELEVRIEQILGTNLHPTKRIWQNLNKEDRQDLRALLRAVIKELWLRGVMNDLLRVHRYTRWLIEMGYPFLHDPWGDREEVPEKKHRLVDSEVRHELDEIHTFITSTPIGTRDIPLDYVEHRNYLARFQKAHVGMGQRVLGFAQTNRGKIQERLDRSLLWGEHFDAELWKENVRSLAKDIRKTLDGLGGNVLRAIGDHILALSIENANRIQDLKDSDLLTQKYALFQQSWPDGGGLEAFGKTIELLVDAEVLYATLVSAGGTSTIEGRNRMAGLAFAISGAAKSFIMSPTYDNLVILGGLGVLGGQL